MHEEKNKRAVLSSDCGFHGETIQTKKQRNKLIDSDPDEGSGSGGDEGSTKAKDDVEIPRIVTDLGRDLHFVKLLDFLSVVRN